MDAMWVWGAIGLTLLAVEMATGTFYILWFGVAALIVGLLAWMMPHLSIGAQMFLFAMLSMGSLFVWRTYYKKTETHSRIGQAQGEEIGREGTVFEVCSKTHTGKIRFSQGVMGSREWIVASDETIEVGSSATVIAVEGNILRVKAV